MCRNILLFSLLVCGMLACSGERYGAEVKQALDQWVPGKYKVMKADALISDTSSQRLVRVQSISDPNLQFTIDYNSKKEQESLSKTNITRIIEAAEKNSKPSQELLKILQKNGLKNVVVGTDLAKKAVGVQLYEEPFNQVFGAHLKQIQNLVTTWATQRNLAPCQLSLLVMEPKMWGQRFKDVVDARFVSSPDAWIDSNMIAFAGSDVATPDAAAFFPGSLRLSDQLEKEIRQKVHAEVRDFLRTSKKMDFHVELHALVNTELDLRKMEHIQYSFPYCALSEETKKNGSCMGNFDGRISCVYRFKTGEMQVDF